MTSTPAFILVTDTTKSNLVSCHELNSSTFTWTQVLALLEKLQHQSVVSTKTIFDGKLKAALVDVVYFVVSELKSNTSTFNFNGAINLTSTSNTSTSRLVGTLLNITDSSYVDPLELECILMHLFLPNVSSGQYIRTINMGVPSSTVVNPPSFTNYNYLQLGYAYNTSNNSYVFLQNSSSNSFRLYDYAIQLSSQPDFPESLIIRNQRIQAIQSTRQSVTSAGTPTITFNNSTTIFPLTKVTVHYNVIKASTTPGYIFMKVGSPSLLTTASAYIANTYALPQIYADKESTQDGIILNCEPIPKLNPDGSPTTIQRLIGSITFTKYKSYVTTNTFESWLFKGQAADFNHNITSNVSGYLVFNATTFHLGAIQILCDGGYTGTVWVTYS